MYESIVMANNFIVQDLISGLITLEQAVGAISRNIMFLV